MAPLVHEGSITEPQAAAIGEIWKAFSIFFSTVSEDFRECFLSLFLFSQAHTLQRRCTCPRCLITHHYPPPRQQWCGHASTERVDIHTGYSPAAYVRNSVTCGVQGGCWEAGSCDEGVVGDVDSESSGRYTGDAGSAGLEAADIASLVLVLRFDIFDTFLFYVRRGYDMINLNKNGKLPDLQSLYALLHNFLILLTRGRLVPFPHYYFPHPLSSFHRPRPLPPRQSLPLRILHPLKKLGL